MTRLRGGNRKRVNVSTVGRLNSDTTHRSHIYLYIQPFRNAILI